MENENVNPETARREPLDAFAFPGAYPILYVPPDGGYVLCATCATEAGLSESDGSIYNEGPTEYCDTCNEPIESAYGDPWAEESLED